MGSPEKWMEVSQVFLLTGMALKARWGCGTPPLDALPSAALESQVDHWCSRLAGNLTLTIDPPADVRPWVLARLSCVVAELRRRGDARIPFPGLSAAEIRDLLTAEWHRSFRDHWNLLVLEDLNDSGEAGA